MLTASDGTLVYFSQPGEQLDETRTHREVSKIAKQYLGDDSSDTGQDVSLTLGGTMALTQPPSPHLEDGEVPEASTPLSALVPVAQRSRKRPRTESGSSMDGSSCLPLKPGHVSSSQTRNRPRQSIQRNAPLGARHSHPLPHFEEGRGSDSRTSKKKFGDSEALIGSEYCPCNGVETISHINILLKLSLTVDQRG
jgi:hypothetical protein